MNPSFELPSVVSDHAAGATWLHRVLSTTVADWRSALVETTALDDDDPPRARRCSLLSRPGQRATAASAH